MERDPKIRLSKQFREVLQDIYDRVDLDNSGSLSRAEFNLFNWRTSGEEVADEEWQVGEQNFRGNLYEQDFFQVVEQNFPLHNNELTLDGFLTLHQMEAEDNQGDPRELRVTVQVRTFDFCHSFLFHAQSLGNGLQSGSSPRRIGQFRLHILFV